MSKVQYKLVSTVHVHVFNVVSVWVVWSGRAGHCECDAGAFSNSVKFRLWFTNLSHSFQNSIHAPVNELKYM